MQKNQKQNQKQNQEQHSKSIWTPVVHFAGHAIVGTILFLIVALPAVLLSLVVHGLEAAHIDGFTVEVLKFLDHAILIADAGLFVAFLVITFIKALREMWK